MKYVYATFIALLLMVCGCEKEEDPFDFLDGPWIQNSLDNVILHTRPAGHSRENSPDSSCISIILNNQNYFIDLINEKLNLNFNSQFKIYLFLVQITKRFYGRERK